MLGSGGWNSHQTRRCTIERHSWGSVNSQNVHITFQYQLLVLFLGFLYCLVAKRSSEMSNGRLLYSADTQKKTSNQSMLLCEDVIVYTVQDILNMYKLFSWFYVTVFKNVNYTTACSTVCL